METAFPAVCTCIVQGWVKFRIDIKKPAADGFTRGYPWLSRLSQEHGVQSSQKMHGSILGAPDLGHTVKQTRDYPTE